jgi:hypothetical protein
MNDALSSQQTTANKEDHPVPLVRQGKASYSFWLKIKFFSNFDWTSSQSAGYEK